MRMAAMGGGLALTLVALFMATLTLRETWTQINLSGFVRTEFVVTGYQEETGDSDAVMSGRVVSSGERFERVRESFVGVDVVRKLKKEGRLKGYRAPVWYLKGTGHWQTVDRVMPFRLQSVDEFGAGSYWMLLAGNLLVGAAAIFPIRWAIARS